MTLRPLVAVTVVAAACRPSAPPAPAAQVQQAATTPPATATSAPAPTPPALPAPPPVRSALAREPSGATALAAGETVVDPAATFEVELEPRLPDARLVLLDAADAHVAAEDVRELGASTRLTLAPGKPLVPGSRYLLRADGAARREMHDESGRAFAPLGFPILVAGTPPPPEAKKPARRRRR